MGAVAFGGVPRYAGWASSLAEAQKLAQSLGQAGFRARMVSHLQLDNFMVRTGIWDKLPAEAYPICAREILAYPERGGVFAKRDIVDSVTGDILPSEFVPPSAIGVKNIALLIDPWKIECGGNGALVYTPASVRVISNVVECGCGRADPLTGMPLRVQSGVIEMLPCDELRWIFRLDGEGVRRIFRDPNKPYEDAGPEPGIPAHVLQAMGLSESSTSTRRCIYADFEAACGFGVLAEMAVPDDATVKMALKLARICACAGVPPQEF